ncbi:6-phosphogluconolactonase [Simkania sp.]|uniref:6-phosphogluconolactonase n=1 Tax=Simkania sp. TaxID=34094 RepID=UPI003B52C00C
MSNMHFFSWDDRRDIAHPGNNEETLAFSIEHFINCAKEAIKMHGHFAVALSGGSTPKAIFNALSQAPYSSAIDWTKAYIFWSDERSVAPTDQGSNFRMAIEAGFKNLPIPAEHFFRMEAEDNIEENALNYEMKIKQVLGTRPFDLIMLGMGEDGHTASLFPGTKALEEKNRLVVANHILQKDTWRMTMTYPLINKAKNIVIYVLGKSKKEMVHQVFLKDHEPPFPVSLIGTPSNKALWILDSDACGDLHKKHK